MFTKVLHLILFIFFGFPLYIKTFQIDSESLTNYALLQFVYSPVYQVYLCNAIYIHI